MVVAVVKAWRMVQRGRRLPRTIRVQREVEEHHTLDLGVGRQETGGVFSVDSDRVGDVPSRGGKSRTRLRSTGRR